MASPGGFTDRSRAGQTRADGAGFGVLWSLLLRRKLLFVLLIGLSTFSVSVAHLWLPLYEAQSALFFETASSSSLQAVSNKLGTFGIQEDEGRALDRYALRLNTVDFYRTVAAELRKTGQDLEMFHKEMLSPRRRVIWNLAKAFHVKLPSTTMSELSDDAIADVLDEFVYFNRIGTDRMNVLVRSGDKKSASIVANVIADLSVKVLLEESVKDLDETHAYIDDQLKQSEKSIHEIEDTLAKLKADHGIVGDSGGNVAAAMQATAIQRQLTEATLEGEENKRRISRLQEELDRERTRDPQIYTNANIDPDNRYGIPRRISELTRAIDMAAMTESALKKLLDQTLHSGNQGDEQKIFDLRKRMEFEYSIFQELKKQAFQLEMRRIGARNKMRVFEHAREAETRRSDSLPVKLAIALILSVFGGLPLAMIWELARPRVRNGKDLSDSGLAYLGGVPTVSGRFVKGSKGQPLRICRFDSDSEVAMSFIQIRSRLLYLADQKDTSAQVITVVSAKTSEGKSFFSRNLAACFGHMGRKTLLIDCDLRKAQNTAYFNALQSQGLGEVLTGTVKFGEAVQPGVVRGMDFMPAGMMRSNITDLFADDALGLLLKDLREVYDHVILDTPSLIAVPDTPLIVRAGDMPMLLASMNDTTQQELEISLDRLRALYGGDICAALNRVTGGQVPLYVIHSGGRKHANDFQGSHDSNISHGPGTAGRGGA